MRRATRYLLPVALAGLTGCTTGSVQARFPCSDDQLVQWQIPPGWMTRELTATEARVEVVTANIVKDSAEARWEALHVRWKDGDQYWLYQRPETGTINALGAQQGVVLIRGCEQLGFVTTRIAAEPTTVR